jgi:hypothetical protein
MVFNTSSNLAQYSSSCGLVGSTLPGFPPMMVSWCPAGTVIFCRTSGLGLSRKTLTLLPKLGTTTKKLGCSVLAVSVTTMLKRLCTDSTLH